MNRTLRQQVSHYSKQIPSVREYVDSEYTRDKEGRLNIEVQCPEHPYDPLSCGKQLDLDPSIYAYLDQKIYYLPVIEQLNLCFHGTAYSAEEQAQIKSCVQEHYMLVFKDKQQDLRINFIMILGLCFLGVTFLTLSFTRALDHALVNETLSIIGSFSMWEAVDLYVLERRHLRAELNNACQSAMANVLFEQD
ncbi:MAG: hypothetical protein LKF79_03745 [Solobacterium sp.]|jgi:hypothetical protein|nr:hypothetical protein [Solobacterium sp.]MCH4222219.1 hypothetical protein [Solobacterium sp.]MCH4265739.1 hypothetical protein [Solobacterium sp.]